MVTHAAGIVVAGEVVGAWQAEDVTTLGGNGPKEGLQTDRTLESILPQHHLQPIRLGLLSTGSTTPACQPRLERQSALLPGDARVVASGSGGACGFVRSFSHAIIIG
jgi:hypothetical protein